MGMSTPVAYIRKSRVIDERNGVSWEVQEAKVRELAAQYGDNGSRLAHPVATGTSAGGRARRTARATGGSSR